MYQVPGLCLSSPQHRGQLSAPSTRESAHFIADHGQDPCKRGVSFTAGHHQSCAGNPGLLEKDPVHPAARDPRPRRGHK
jgi:hypothetical protein